MAKMLPRLINRTLALAGGALAVFHGWLFVSQAVAGRLGDPWVIFRWLAAAALIAALVAVHRRGHLLWGRKGIAIWLLAAMLHAPAIADNESFETFALPEAVAASLLQLASSAGVAIGLWMLAGLLAARRASALTIDRLVPVVVVARRFSAGHATRFSPRPPPQASAHLSILNRQ
jgi:hypothetical protein